MDVRSAGISNVIENERILELPLQGRQVTDLLVLVGRRGADRRRRRTAACPAACSISVAGGLPFGVATRSMARRTTTRRATPTCRCRSPMRCRNSASRPAGSPPQNGVHSGAAVNAVTKSGTNRFSGNAFEFLRDHRFNATSPFAAIGPDGKRLDDGLKRNQFGGTLGGPIVDDKLFFFGAYQGTIARVSGRRRTSRTCRRPRCSPATSRRSPRRRATAAARSTLRAPFVNNRIDPARFSPAALNIVKRLPTHDRSLRPDHVRRARTTATSSSRSHASTTS